MQLTKRRCTHKLTHDGDPRIMSYVIMYNVHTELDSRNFPKKNNIFKMYQKTTKHRQNEKRSKNQNETTHIQ